MEYASTALSLTPVAGPWQEVLKQISSYLRMQHPPYSGPTEHTALIVVDAAQRKEVEVKSFGLEKPLPDERAGLEYWRQSTWELWFGPYSAFVSVCLRAVNPDETEVELWFPTSVREAVFGFDADRKNLDTKVKSELMRLLIGVARATRAAGFGYGFVDDDILFGPPPLDLVRGYVTGEIRNPQSGRRLLVAGLDSQHLDASRFVYDTDSPRVHYRQSGYYLCDRIWPVDAFLGPPKESDEDHDDD